MFQILSRLVSKRVGGVVWGWGRGVVPWRSLASFGLVKASQAEKAINQEVNCEASPVKIEQAGALGVEVSMALTG